MTEVFDPFHSVSSDCVSVAFVCDDDLLGRFNLEITDT